MGLLRPLLFVAVAVTVSASGSHYRYTDYSCCTCANSQTECVSGRQSRTYRGYHQYRRCNNCEVRFQPWTAWTSCTCQEGNLGTKTRTRVCPATDGCGWTRRQNSRCTRRDCATGTIGEWSQWTECSKTCGGGRRTRTRTCTGGICRERTSQSDRCNRARCPVGTFGPWSAWGSCSATCGRARKTRTRTCETVLPCQGPTVAFARCYGLRRCPPPPIGQWGAWEAWSACSRSCGRGYRYRRRTCPTGYRCAGGRSVELDRCGTAGSCSGPSWGAWSAWTTCSATCDGGTRTRTRTCPAGATCPGPATDQQNCNTFPCASWSAWGVWSACSVTCGSGSRTRTRTCQNESPMSTCAGSATDSETCTQTACPNPTWGAWTPWTECSATCGTGTRSRSRTCTNGATCTGESSQTENCNTDICITCGKTKYADGLQDYPVAAIVGGKTTRPNEVPWQINLREIEALNTIFCGGSIINETHILTAAHCVWEEGPGTMKMYAGDQTLATTETTEQVRDIVEVFIHPNYNNLTLDNDIAILRLSSPLTFNENVMPVCLPMPGQTFVNTEVVISGWGKLTTNDPGQPNELQYAVVEAVADSVCEQIYSYHADDVVCGSDTYNNVQRSSCFGDSGGPMVVNVGGMWVQVGVASYVSFAGCAAGSEFGYRDVEYHLGWIKTNTVTQFASPAG